MVNYVSTNNNNKFSTSRTDGNITTIVITYSHCPDINDTITTLHHRGASVHYTIESNGYQNQYHTDDQKTFTSGVSQWHGKNGVNDYSISFMLINDGSSLFPADQIAKLTSSILDIYERHNQTMEVVGLGEVAPNRHIAPGKLFPWNVLAEAGIGKQVALSDNLNTECKINPGDEGDLVAQIQRNLATHGYGIKETGVYDDLTAKVINVFRDRYTSSEQGLNCWNDVAEYTLNDLLGLDNSKLLLLESSEL